MKFTLIALIISASLLPMACSKTNPKKPQPDAAPVETAKGPGTEVATVGMIEPAELKKRIEAGDKLTLLDVRTPAEVEQPPVMLKNAINIPLNELPGRVKELDPASEVIVICRSGRRAVAASQILQQSGFKSLKILAGGMLAYEAMGK